MKRMVPIFLFLIFVMSVGVAATDPGPNNPYRDMIVNVDCAGEEHDYDMLYTVGLSPWFDPQGTAVATGPTLYYPLQFTPTACRLVTKVTRQRENLMLCC